MKVNSINTKQNFGMPIAKDTYLDKLKNDYLDMYMKLNKYSTPEYKKHVTDMSKALVAIDEMSPNYIVGVYTPKLEKPMIYPPCVLYAYPQNKKKNAVQITLTDTNYPFLNHEDLCKISFYVKFIESMNLE